MKKTLLSLMALAAIVSTQAQSSKTTGIHFIPRAGINFTNINGKDISGEKDNGKLKTGFHLGADVEIPLADEFYLQPGLLFSTKGSKNDKGAEGKLNLSYLEIPVSFMFKPTLGDGRLLLGAGPYMGFGLGGKFKADGSPDMDVKFKNEIPASEYGNTDYVYVKNLDYGANLTAGYELSMGLSFQLNAQLGLANIATKVSGLPSGFKQSKASNTGFGISAGYRF